MEQSVQTNPITHETVLRWWVHTDQGRKVAWAPTAAKAREKWERKGLRVARVSPGVAG